MFFFDNCPVHEIPKYNFIKLLEDCGEAITC